MRYNIWDTDKREQVARNANYEEAIRSLMELGVTERAAAEKFLADARGIPLERAGITVEVVEEEEFV